MARITIRAARPEDLPQLYREIGQVDGEAIDLAKAIVFVAEVDGEPVGMIAGRMIFQVEPLLLFEKFRAERPRNALRRATLLLARAMDGYLRQAPWSLGAYYAYIRDRGFQALAERFGMRPVYQEGRWFLKDL